MKWKLSPISTSRKLQENVEKKKQHRKMSAFLFHERNDQSKARISRSNNKASYTKRQQGSKKQH